MALFEVKTNAIMTTRQARSCTGRNAGRQSRQSSIWCGRKTIQLLAILSVLFILLPDVGIQFRKGDIAEFTETPPPHTADCNLNLSSMEKVKCTPFRSISSSTFKCSFHFDAIVVAENFWDTFVLGRVGLVWSQWTAQGTVLWPWIEYNNEN